MSAHRPELKGLISVTPNWTASAERVRARETERVLRKLDLSPEQAEAVERLSLTLVENLVIGPIANVTAITERTGESAASREV
jgi:glutamyl-tRNA reductase